jgi:hypothetical protein
MEFHIRAEQAGDSGRIAEIIKAVFTSIPTATLPNIYWVSPCITDVSVLSDPRLARGFYGSAFCPYQGTWGGRLIRYSPVRADFAGDSKVGNRITM